MTLLYFMLLIILKVFVCELTALSLWNYVTCWNSSKNHALFFKNDTFLFLR